MRLKYFGKLSLVGLCTMMSLTLGLSQTTPPDIVNYQGVLHDASDEPITGSRDMVFRLFSAASAGEEILVDSHLAAGSGSVALSDGLFSVKLGSGDVSDGSGAGTYTSLSDAFRDYQTLYLELEVGGETLSPRVELAATGFALNADRVDGRDASEFSLVGHTHAGSEIVGPVASADDAALLEGESGSFYLSRLNHSGTQAPSTISPQGAGSGLDADYVDGLSSTSLLRSNASDAFTSGTMTFSSGTTLDVIGSLRSGRLTDRDDTTTYVDPSGTSVLEALRVNTSAYINADGPESSSSLYFYNGGSVSGSALTWDDPNNRFQFNNGLHVIGDITCTGDCGGGGTSSNADTLDFIDSWQFLRSDSSDNFTSGTFRFFSPTTLRVEGTFYSSTIYDIDSASYSMDPSGSSYFNYLDGAVIASKNDIRVNSDGPSGTDGYIYFYHGGSAFGRYIYWDDSANLFSSNAGFRINYIQASNPAYYLQLSGTSVLYDVDINYDLEAPRLVDANDNSFVLDPSNFSQLYSMDLTNDLWARNITADADVLAYSDLVTNAGQGSALSRVFFGTGNSLIHSTNTGRFEFSDDLYTLYSITAPIIYDTNNTLYYLDLNNTSEVNTLNAFSVNSDSTSVFERFGTKVRAAYDNDIGIWAEAGSTSAYALIPNMSQGGYFNGTSDGVNAYGSQHGGNFSGQTAGVRGQDTTSSVWAYLAYGTYNVYGSGTSSMMQNHPSDSESVISYSAPQGNEAATYVRGTARLEAGKAVISLDETFSMVTNPSLGLTAHLTPRGDCGALYVESITPRELVVRESGEGTSDALFDYLVFGLRLGFEDVPTVKPREFEAPIPSIASTRDDLGANPERASTSPRARFTAMANAAGMTLPADDSAEKALLKQVGVAIEGVPIFPVDDGPTPEEREARWQEQEKERIAQLPPPQQVVETPPVEPPTPAVITSGPAEQDALSARSVATLNADLAQAMKVRGEFEVGDVVVIDPEGFDTVVPASSDFDPTVVGIVATSAGVVAGVRDETDVEIEEGDEVAADEPGVSEVPVVVTGIALCKVDASYDVIRRGDLLTTSATPGHARRAADPMPGTIIGKALEDLDGGTGVIRVLVLMR